MPTCFLSAAAGSLKKCFLSRPHHTAHTKGHWVLLFKYRSLNMYYVCHFSRCLDAMMEPIHIEIGISK
jgi:hypothetical protein